MIDQYDMGCVRPMAFDFRPIFGVAIVGDMSGAIFMSPSRAEILMNLSA